MALSAVSADHFGRLPCRKVFHKSYVLLEMPTFLLGVAGMRRKSRVLTLAFAILLAASTYSASKPRLNAVASFGVVIDLFTQKGGRGFNQSGGVFKSREKVILSALLTSDEKPIPNKLVSFEVRGPQNQYTNITIYRVVSTNASGMSEIDFAIPWPDENPEAIVLGVWKAVSTVSVDGQVYADMLDFQVEQTLVLETDKDVYGLGENVTITLVNIGNETVSIGGYPPWQIFTYPAEEPVYPSIFATKLWSLKPGENDTFTWNQYDEFNGTFCGRGRYVVKDTQGWGLRTYFLIDPPSDVDGDGKVGLEDAVAVLDAFGSVPGASKWRENCDLDYNFRVDMGDLVIVLDGFGKYV
jgi:hypothetical protein